MSHGIGLNGSPLCTAGEIKTVCFDCLHCDYSLGLTMVVFASNENRILSTFFHLSVFESKMHILCHLSLRPSLSFVFLLPVVKL